MENALEDKNFMAGKEKGLTSATYHAAGNPNMANCSNRTCIKGTSRHYFPKDETLRQKCFWFVRIHRLWVPRISMTFVSILWASQCTTTVEN